MSPTDALTAWQFEPAVSAGLIVAAAGYLTATALVARRHRSWPARRTLAFLLGLLVIAVATQGSPGVYDDVLFSAHMVQHLLLIMVAPPLLILGRPATLLLHATRNPAHTWVKGVLRSPVVSGLTWPLAAASLYVAVVAATHLTPLMSLVRENAAVHDAEHVVYLIVGYLYFLPVIGSEPLPHRLSRLGRYLLLLATMPADMAVGAVLMAAPHGWFGYDVGDLHRGGLIMLAGSDLIMTVLAVILAAGFVRARPPGARAEVPADLDAYNAYLAALGRGRTR